MLSSTVAHTDNRPSASICGVNGRVRHASKVTWDGCNSRAPPGSSLQRNRPPICFGTPLPEAILQPVPSFELECRRRNSLSGTATGHPWGQNDRSSVAERRVGLPPEAGQQPFEASQNTPNPSYYGRYFISSKVVTLLPQERVAPAQRRCERAPAISDHQGACHAPSGSSPRCPRRVRAARAAPVEQRRLRLRLGRRSTSANAQPPLRCRGPRS